MNQQERTLYFRVVSRICLLVVESRVRNISQERAGVRYVSEVIEFGKVCPPLSHRSRFNSGIG
jgi:hypothetical protein